MLNEYCIIFMNSLGSESKNQVTLHVVDREAKSLHLEVCSKFKSQYKATSNSIEF